MSNQLFLMIDQISREKGIDPQIVVDAIEDAIVVASRKYFKSNEELRSRINPESGEIEVFAVKTVVETVEDDSVEISLEEAQAIKDDAQVDDEVEFRKSTAGLGRIAAQMAKQVIFQKVREAERESVYAEYHEQVGEIVNCVVKRFENGDVIVELGKTEGRIPRREQSRLEAFAMGDRIRVVIIRVEKTAKGPPVVVSRGDPILVQHLFQTEVPEIYDGTVEIRRIAREAGERTKIAVASRGKRRGPCWSVRRHEGIACPVHHPGIARGKDRHHPVVGQHRHLRDQRDQSGKGEPSGDGGRARRHARGRRSSRAGHGNRRRGQPVVAGDRQEGTERPAGLETDRVADRHQE